MREVAVKTIIKNSNIPTTEPTIVGVGVDVTGRVNAR